MNSATSQQPRTATAPARRAHRAPKRSHRRRIPSGVHGTRVPHTNTRLTTTHTHSHSTHTLTQRPAATISSFFFSCSLEPPASSSTCTGARCAVRVYRAPSGRTNSAPSTAVTISPYLLLSVLSAQRHNKNIIM